MNAALYARVSTDDKDQDPETQLFQLRAYARAHGYKVIKEYVDHATGRNANRPQFRNLEEDMLRKRFDTILVRSNDRIMRNNFLFHQFLKAVEDCGCRYIAIREDFDTSTPAGRLMRNMVASMAEFYVDDLSIKTKEGMERAKRQGKHIGRKPTYTDSQMKRARLLLHQKSDISWHELERLTGISRRTLKRNLSLKREGAKGRLESLYGNSVGGGEGRTTPFTPGIEK